jgi:hypothetical protein
LAASGFALEITKDAKPQQSARKIKIPAAAHQRKTGIYNTLDTNGQT